MEHWRSEKNKGARIVELLAQAIGMEMVGDAEGMWDGHTRYMTQFRSTFVSVKRKEGNA